MIRVLGRRAETRAGLILFATGNNPTLAATSAGVL
jgi:hypothetical protein